MNLYFELYCVDIYIQGVELWDGNSQNDLCNYGTVTVLVPFNFLHLHQPLCLVL